MTDREFDRMEQELYEMIEDSKRANREHQRLVKTLRQRQRRSEETVQKFCAESKLRVAEMKQQLRRS